MGKLKLLVLISLVLGGGEICADEHNAIDGLKAKKVCESVKSTADTPTSHSYKPIDKSQIVKAAIGTNSVLEHLIFGSSKDIETLVLEAMVPCSEIKDEKIKSPTTEDRIRACFDDWQKVYVPGSTRFKDKKGVRIARNNLLRSFQAAATGGNEDFLVVRRHWVDFDKVASDEETQKKYKSLIDALEKIGPVDYRPFSSQMHDDLNIILFFSSSEPNFETYCKKETFRTGKNVDCTKKSQSSKCTVRKFIPTEFDQNDAYNIRQEKLWADKVADYAAVWGPARYISKKRTTYSKCELLSANTTSCDKGPNHEFEKTENKNHISIVKSSDQFAKGSDAEGATVGTTLPLLSGSELESAQKKISNAEDITFVADAALGWSFERVQQRSIYDVDSALVKQQTSTDTWTPYVSVTQSVQQYDVLLRDEAGQPFADDEGDVATSRKNIAYAEIAAGIRWERNNRSYLNETKTNNVIRPFSYATTNREKIGWDFALQGELRNDNYNLTQSSLFGAEIALPGEAYGRLGEAYKNQFGIDSIRGVRKGNGDAIDFLENAFSGLFVEWDIVYHIDYLNYGQRPPDFTPSRSFDEPDTLVEIPRQDGFLEGLLVGTETELKLSKYDFLSLGETDLYASLSLSHSNRRSVSDGQTADLWSAELKFIDPMQSKRFLSLLYRDGERFRSSQEDDDVFSFNVGYRF